MSLFIIEFENPGTDLALHQQFQLQLGFLENN